MNKYLIPAAVVVVIAIAVITFNSSDSTEQTPSTFSNSTSAVVSQEPEKEGGHMSVAMHNDGTYTDVGNYVSPGGPREINVTVTLENGVITDAVFEGLATDPTSMRFQGEFGDNFKTMVVGKNIDEVKLTKVAGSSLTPIGFTDALSKIKERAKS